MDAMRATQIGGQAPIAATTHHVQKIDKAWANRLVLAPDVFHGVSTLKVAQTELPAVSDPAWQQEVRRLAPFRQVKELQAPVGTSLVQLLSLPIPDAHVRIAHVVYNHHSDVDLRRAFQRHHQIEFISVSRELVPIPKLLEGILHATRREEETTGCRLLLEEEPKQEMIAQGQRIDLARILFCAGQTVQEFAPASLRVVQLVFRAHEVDDFFSKLRQALRMRIDLSAHQGPTVATTLSELSQQGARSHRLTWQVVWQTQKEGPFYACALALEQQQSFSYNRAGATHLPDYPFHWKLLSTRSTDADVSAATTS